MFKNITLSILLTFSFLGSVSAQEASAKRAPSSIEIQEINTKSEIPVLDFFHGAECPHCQREKKWHPLLKAMFPTIQINEYEVWHDPENQKLLQARLDKLGKTSTGVPTNIIGEEVITGFDAKSIIKAITKTYGIEPLEIDEAKVQAEIKDAGKQKKLIIFAILALVLAGGGFFILKQS